MSDIFNSRAGFVAVIEDQTVIPGKIQIQGFDPQSGLVSGISYNQRANLQFQYALDDSVYIYVFGDLMGDIVVQGRSFAAMCDGDGGLQEVFDYYSQNRASKTETQVVVGVGDETVVGFLTAIRVRGETASEDPAAFYMGWELIISSLPKD